MDLFYGGEPLAPGTVDSQPYSLGIGDSAIATTPG